MESTKKIPILQTIRKKLHDYGELVMFSHTLFSLPFALIALFLAADGFPELRVFFWIMLALFAGRNGANALNRYVDAEIDQKNPRTASRHIPAGKVRRQEALYITIACYILFVVAAAQINPLCLYLSPVALILFTLYSYTKRFTWLCHIILGITCAGAPVGAWIAIKGQLDLPAIALGAVVTMWVAGFDIIYGTQDIAFDTKAGLFSIPARFGLRNSLWIARALHLLMWLTLLSLILMTQLSYIYFVGVVVSGVLLIMEHAFVDSDNRKKMNFVSYHLNQIISMVLLFSASMDIFF